MGGTLWQKASRAFWRWHGKHRVPCQRMQPHDLTLVPFRECHHDAPELGHVYNLRLGGARVVVPYGYSALVHARHLMRSWRTMVVATCGTDLKGGRLLVELYAGVGGATTTGVSQNLSWAELADHTGTPCIPPGLPEGTSYESRPARIQPHRR